MITYDQATNTFYIENKLYVSKYEVGLMLEIPHKEKFTVKIKNCKSIEKDAFAGIGTIRTVIFENVELIDQGAFRGCKNLLNAKFDNVAHICAMAFTNTGLRKILLPKSLIHIGPDAFACTKLKEVLFVNNETSSSLDISSRAFADIRYIKKFDFPCQLKSLGGKVFEGTEIEQISVGASISFANVIGLCDAFTNANIHTLVFRKEPTEVITEYVIPDKKALVEILKEGFDVS